jgi:hypothetical protein
MSSMPRVSICVMKVAISASNSRDCMHTTPLQQRNSAGSLMERNMTKEVAPTPEVKRRGQEAPMTLDEQLDEALGETFPASDPTAVHPEPEKQPAKN